MHGHEHASCPAAPARNATDWTPAGNLTSVPAGINAPLDKAREFMRQYAAEKLTANPVEKKADKVPKGWLD